MNMLEKAIVSVRGTDIVPVDRCMVDMGFAPELEGSVPEDYMTCDEDEVLMFVCGQSIVLLKLFVISNDWIV